MEDNNDSYYDRQPIRHVDDTWIFRREGDMRVEELVAEQIRREWKVEANNYGLLSPIDWWFARAGRPLGFLIITSSKLYSTTRYSLLNIRKYRRLVDSIYASDCLGFYVCKFADRIMHIDATIIDARRLQICENKRGRGRNDREPIIQIPTAHMRPLRGSRYQDAW